MMMTKKSHESEDTKESESDTVSKTQRRIILLLVAVLIHLMRMHLTTMVALIKLTKIQLKVLEQMKNRRMSTVRVKQMNAWMHDDELESRAPQGVQHV